MTTIEASRITTASHDAPMAPSAGIFHGLLWHVPFLALVGFLCGRAMGWW